MVFSKKMTSEASRTLKNLRGIVVFKIARDVNSHPGGRRATLKKTCFKAWTSDNTTTNTPRKGRFDDGGKRLKQLRLASPGEIEPYGPIRELRAPRSNPTGRLNCEIEPAGRIASKTQ